LEEFNNNTIRDLAKKYKFRAVWSSPYQPNGNSVVERVNKTLKEMMYQSMEKYKTKEWLDHLQSFVDCYNNTKHSTTKMKPIDLINAGTKIVEKLDTKLTESRKRKAKEAPSEDIAVGDTVRIDLSIYPHTRKEIMLNGRKSYVKRWSEEVYVVRKVLEPKAPGRLYEYQVKHKTNGSVLGYKLKSSQIRKVENPKPFNFKKPKIHPSFFSREAHLARKDQ
jgi:transposase InsO family protein